MRLLMTTDTVGGVWTYTTTLIPELLARDVAVVLVTVGHAPSASQTEWLNQVEDGGDAAFCWEASEAPLEWMSDNQGAYRSAEPLLLRVAHEFGAELLHSNQFCFGALPVPLAKLVVAHSDVLSWAAECREQPLEPSAWLSHYSALVAGGLQAADAVVAPTLWMLRALAANYKLPPTATVIPNGRTLPDAGSEPEGKLQAVTAGRLWDEGKNLKMLAQVQSPIPLILAGDTVHESQSLPALPSSISLLGRLEEAALSKLFRESAMYVCTSRYEPFGLAPIEAALCGCAVLANDIPSLREVWGDGAIYFNNAASLSAQLARLSNHPDELAAAQQRSLRSARGYSATAMAGKYLELYKAMLAPPGKATHVA